MIAEHSTLVFIFNYTFCPFMPNITNPSPAEPCIENIFKRDTKSYLSVLSFAFPPSWCNFFVNCESKSEFCKMIAFLESIESYPLCWCHCLSIGIFFSANCKTGSLEHWFYISRIYNIFLTTWILLLPMWFYLNKCYCQ